MREIRQNDIVKAIEEIVLEQPKFTYPDSWAEAEGGCKYFRNGAPACLIGHYIARSELQHAVVVEGLCASEALKRIARDNEVRFSQPALDFANDVQSYQDSGFTWYESFTYALHAITKAGNDD